MMVSQQNEIRLEWTNLEPTRDDNLSLWVVPVDHWQDVLRWQVQVNRTSQDAKAWEALAQAYATAGEGKNVSFVNARWAELFIFACENSLTINPNNAALHARFAQTLYYANWRGRDPYYNALILREIAVTLHLDPSNELALRLLTYIRAEGVYAGEGIPTAGAPFPTQSPITPAGTADIPYVPFDTSLFYPAPTSTMIRTPLQMDPSPPFVEATKQSTAAAAMTQAATNRAPGRITTSGWVIVGFLVAVGGFAGGWWLRAKKH